MSMIFREYVHLSAVLAQAHPQIEIPSGALFPGGCMFHTLSCCGRECERLASLQRSRCYISDILRKGHGNNTSPSGKMSLKAWLWPRKDADRGSCLQVFIELGIWILVEFYKRTKSKRIQRRWGVLCNPWPAATGTNNSWINKSLPALMPRQRLDLWVCEFLQNQLRQSFDSDQCRLLRLSKWSKIL